MAEKKKVVAVVNLPLHIQGKRVALPGGKMRVVKPLEELFEGDPFIAAYPSMVIMREGVSVEEEAQVEPEAEKQLLVEDPIGDAEVEEETVPEAETEEAQVEPEAETEAITLEEAVRSIKSKSEMDELGAAHGVELDRRRKLVDMKEDFFAALAEK